MEARIRLTKEEYVCYLALAASARSEDYFTKSGAALLDIHGNVLGTGTNGLRAGMKVPEWMTKEENRAEKSLLYLHAESNLFLKKKEGDEHLLGLTCSPCVHCSKLISASKVKKVVFVKKYERGTDDYKRIFDFYNIEYRILIRDEISRILSVLSDDMTILSTELLKY